LCLRTRTFSIVIKHSNSNKGLILKGILFSGIHSDPVYTVPDEFGIGLKFVLFRLFTREFVLLGGLKFVRFRGSRVLTRPKRTNFSPVRNLSGTVLTGSQVSYAFRKVSVWHAHTNELKETNWERQCVLTHLSSIFLSRITIWELFYAEIINGRLYDEVILW
jgi:hypothetical protein